MPAFGLRRAAYHSRAPEGEGLSEVTDEKVINLRTRLMERGKDQEAYNERMDLKFRMAGVAGQKKQ